MQPQEYTVVEHTLHVPEVYILKVAPKGGGEVFQYTAGQFAQLKNLHAPTPNTFHSFSIASSPNTKDHLEFCYKTYGPWTHVLAEKKVGDDLVVSGPFGKFVWDDVTTDAVFLAGGVGLVPMLSMMRFLAETQRNPNINLVYGNRTEDTIAYKAEIDRLAAMLTNTKVVHILSHVTPQDPWKGARGFVTKELLLGQCNLSANPTFFLCGPPVFVDLMKKVLQELQVDPTKIKHELFSSPPPPKV